MTANLEIHAPLRPPPPGAQRRSSAYFNILRLTKTCLVFDTQFAEYAEYRRVAGVLRAHSVKWGREFSGRGMSVNVVDSTPAWYVPAGVAVEAAGMSGVYSLSGCGRGVLCPGRLLRVCVVWCAWVGSVALVVILVCIFVFVCCCGVHWWFRHVVVALF